MKSTSKFLSLKISGVLFLGATMIIGVVKALSQNKVLPAEATTAYKPYGIAFDSNLVDSYRPNTANATSGSAVDGKWTWSNSTGVTFSEANFIYIQSSTGTAKGTYKHLKFTIQSGKTAQIAFHNNKEINLTGAGVEMYCDRELSMSVHDNTGKINISKNITGEKTRDTNVPGSAYVYGTTGSGSGIESYCDTLYIEFTNNQSSTAVIYISTIQVYAEDHVATYNLNGGHFPNAEYLNTIYCIAGNLYLFNYSDPSKIMTPTANPITIPVKEDYFFKGFYKEDTFENIFIDETGYLVDGIDHRFTSPFNLYAKWATAGQPVTIAAGTGVSEVFTSTDINATTGNPSGYCYESGNLVYGFAVIRNGATPLAGWTHISNNVYRVNNGYTIADAEVNFGTIACTLTPYHITYDIDDGEVATDNPTTYNVDTETFTLINPTKTGYTFTGWSGTDLDGEDNLEVTIAIGSTGDRSYTAHYSLDTYSITYDLKGGSLSSDNPTEYTYLTDDFTLNNPTKTGYSFLGWTGSNGDIPQTTVTIPQNSFGDKSYTANWQVNNYKVTLNRGGADSGTPYVNVDYGSEMPDIVIPTLSHKTFTGYWDGNDESICTQYYDAEGHSTHVWDKETNSTIYAHYRTNLEFLSVTDTTHTYDGSSHSYGVLTLCYYEDNVQKSIYEGEYDILFSADEGATYTLDKSEGATFVNAGTYTVYFQATKEGFTSLIGSFDIVINKADASMTPPDAREELVYDGNPMYLTTRGYSDDGMVMYNIDGGEWQSERPQVTNAGTYTVGYKVIGDINHNDTEPQYVSVTIAKADYETSVSLAGWSYGETPNSPSVSNNPESGAVTYEYKEKSAAEETYSTTVPTNAGEYTVRATIATTTNYKQEVATTDFTISKVAPTQVDPTAKTDLVYTGSAQDLINAGSSSDGTMKYKLGDNGVYSEEIPSATNAGDYTVYYKVFGDPNHEDSAEQSLVVTIGKAQAVLTAPTGKSGLHYTGEDQVLINAGSSTFGEVLYKVNDGEYSTSLPVGKNVGNYTVYYKVESTDNYDGIAEASITVSIAENNKNALVNAINNADSYHDNIEDKYDIFANDIQDAINKANEVLNNPNVTEAEIARAIEELNNAISKAQNDVTKVEEAIESINKIGDVNYDIESEDAIKAAREIYDGLTDEQKEQLGENYVKILTNAETKYASTKKTADILFIVLLIVSSLALIGGVWFLIVLAKKRKKEGDDDNKKNGGSKKEPVKAMSIGGFLPFVILTSNYLKMPWIIVYIIAGLAILVWISVLVLAIVKKNKKQDVSKKSNQIQSEVKPVETKLVDSSKNEEEEEVETVTDEKGNIFQIRFIKSFTAKLIQSTEETKKYYEELKNEVLSYKNTHSRVSWYYDAVNSGREYVLKFSIRGKTLCVYLPLNPEKIEEKYKVERSESKRFEDVPCLYRIKNDRRLSYAKELIAVVASNLDLEKGEEQHEVYSNLPYEANKPLVARGLIKEQKVQVNKPSEVVIDTKVDEEGDEIVTTVDNTGQQYEIRYLKSFTAKLSQTDDEIKDFYNELKNYALSFRGSSSRVSWNYDSINVGRKPALKFVMKRKNLAIYYALDTSKIGQKYKVEKVEYKKYEDVPCMYLIINEKRKELAKALIDRIMRQFKCKEGEKLKDEYRVPFESKEALLKKGLIREVRTRK